MNLLNEVIERGYHLNYLRGSATHWEASISRVLPEQTPNGEVYAVGYGSGPLPSIALDVALDTVENDYERLEPSEPAPYPQEAFGLPSTFDLAAALANLRKPTAPVFRRKL